MQQQEELEIASLELTDEQIQAIKQRSLVLKTLLIGQYQ